MNKSVVDFLKINLSNPDTYFNVKKEKSCIFDRRATEEVIVSR